MPVIQSSERAIKLAAMTENELQTEVLEQNPGYDERELELLQEELPETEVWKPHHFRAALWQYRMCLEQSSRLQNQQATDGFDEMLDKVNDVLFLRDEIEAAAEYHGWHPFDENDDIADIELLDERLQDTYKKNNSFAEFIRAEYSKFRPAVAPPKEQGWWWLDE